MNDFNKRDKNVGVNIKLRNIYLEEQLPHYVWKTNNVTLCDLKELLSKYIIDNNEKKMLLILGQPGIGKSTLITWIIANLVKEKNQVLVYQFASDLKNLHWESDNILDEILRIKIIRQKLWDMIPKCINLFFMDSVTLLESLYIWRKVNDQRRLV